MTEHIQDPSNSQCRSPVTYTPQVENHATSTPIRRVEIEQVEAPYVGMLFETVDEARKYYEEYGREEGFWIRTQSSKRTRSRSDEVTSCQFVCAHQGKYVWKKTVKEGWKQNNQTETSENDTETGNEDANGTEHAEKGSDMNKKKVSRNCSIVKCGCKASMRIIHDKWSNKWKVSVFRDFHNHKVVTPVRRKKMKSNKHMPKAARSMTEIFHKENLPIAKVHSILGGAQIGFNKRDCYNHLRNVRHRQLDGGDAQSVLTYFRKKQAENPQFFYAIQCDEDGRATNFFWVDARSHMAYEYFGDMVTFDTTYKTNKYDMPFAPFTGVNHHWQSIQFGCALLQDETETTFLWLFETWLQAMGGRHPISIITDQDLAMKGAIAKIFPNTHHRLCLWHIKKKFVEKLSHVYYKKSKFKKEMKKCIQFTYRTEDFEDKWKTLMTEYELEENDWLNNLYEIRTSWVPVYHHGTFFAGMNTTGRSEGINSFFDGFVTSTTNLREFVVRYDQALKRIIENESEEDFESEHKFRIVNDDEFLLKDASKLYTRNIFNKFKAQWSQINHYKVEEREHDNEWHSYLVKKRLGEHEQDFMVKLDLTTYEGSYECQNFEFVGILCRHLLKVFSRLDMETIPAHFILPRWRQEANKFRIMDSEDLVKSVGREDSEAARLSHLCHQATKLACIAATSTEGYTLFMDALNEISKKLLKLPDQSAINKETSATPLDQDDHTMETSASPYNNDLCINIPSTQSLLLDPNISKTKGRKKETKSSGRIKSGVELAMETGKRKCTLCSKSGHNKQTCSLNPQRRRSE